MIVFAIKDFYIAIGCPMEYSADLVEYDEEHVPVRFGMAFEIDEQAYILATAMLKFLERLAGQWNTRTSYTTDAMAVTKGTEPYKNIVETIDRVRERWWWLWHHMSRYNTVVC